MRLDPPVALVNSLPRSLRNQASLDSSALITLSLYYMNSVLSIRSLKKTFTMGSEENSLALDVNAVERNYAFVFVDVNRTQK